MNAHRDRHVAGQAPDCRYPRSSEDAWRTAPGVVREYTRGFRNGFIAAMVFYGMLSALLVLAFSVLGFRP